MLLVEDNADDELLALQALECNRVDSQVDVVRDGQEALDYLFAEGRFADRQGAANPDVILLDINLPKINGLEVLKRIRANAATRMAPVVVLTSSTEDSDVRECYRLGANSYIQKPVDFGEFIKAVGNISNYWLRYNESPRV
ncbi:two-component system response regulator [Methylogaea oryzae]|uniref:Two-component system response regulator n=2 Tax=Methylogaea oryzae TaxID=1295382 RepID=A0A8D5AMI5_9GAMM|nr:two-component system response regulator [Methylogaea oryzae]